MPVSTTPLSRDDTLTGGQLLRKMDADYADGIGAINSEGKANPREVSNTMFAQEKSNGNDQDVSAFLWIWGQFLDHDISLTRDKADDGSFQIPTDDPWFDPTGTGTQTMGLHRSTFDPATGTAEAGARQQINSITPYVDASNVYGSDIVRMAALRNEDGTMKTSEGDLLPFNTTGLDNAPHTGATLFLAGDIRANENVALTSTHTVFVREHNRLVEELKKLHPDWTGDQLFNSARKMVEAEVQKITYEEYLPVLIGEDAIEAYSGFKADIDPQIANIFSTAAYRVGHTMLGGKVYRTKEDGSESSYGNLDLRDAFFRPDRISREGGIDDVLRGGGIADSEEIDSSIIDDVRNFLFGAPGSGGFDLAALNIQRGRDHGLADYNTARKAYGLDPITSFAQISDDPDIQAQLAKLYTSVDTIDAFVGGLAEDAAPGALVGEFFQAVIAEQFTRLRDGDPLWHENTLTAEEQALIDGLNLSQIIELNSGIDHMQDDVFTTFTRKGGTDGDDLIIADVDKSLLIGGDGNDILVGSNGAAGDQLEGGLGNDHLYGSDGADTLYGGEGDDSLHGEGGNDLLRGGAGDDFLTKTSA